MELNTEIKDCNKGIKQLNIKLVNFSYDKFSLISLF